MRANGIIWTNSSREAGTIVRIRGINTARHKRGVMAGISATLLLVLIAGAGIGEASRQTPFAEFPLDKDVAGSGPFATLGEGQLPNGTRWGVWASRIGAGRLGYERPCLSLARITRHGLYADRHMCGELVPAKSGSKPVYVSIAASYHNRPDGPTIRESVLGLSFRPTVTSAVLKYSDGGELHRPTRYFNAKQQQKTKLPPFRYIALALRDDVCVETVIGYSAAGSELFSADTNLCF